MSSFLKSGGNHLSLIASGSLNIDVLDAHAYYNDNRCDTDVPLPLELWLPSLHRSVRHVSPPLLSELTLVGATIVQSVATASKGVTAQYLIRSMRAVWRWPRIRLAIQRSAWRPRKIRLSPSSAWKDNWSKSHAIWAFVKMQTVTCRNEHEFYNLEQSPSICR